MTSKISHPILSRSNDLLSTSISQLFILLHVNSWLFLSIFKFFENKVDMPLKCICNLCWAAKEQALRIGNVLQVLFVSLYAHVNNNETWGEQTVADEWRCASVCYVSAWITNRCKMNSLLPLSSPGSLLWCTKMF